MKMKKTFKIIFIPILILLLSFSNAKADWNNFRDYETVIITGQSIPEFLTVPVNQVFVYSYNLNEKKWQQITFQIDEKDGGSDYFITPNQIIDSNDEILFMAKDAGDQSTGKLWIEDEDSRQYNRYEIEVSDPNDPQNKRYIYVYRSTTLIHSAELPVYMTYVPNNSGYSDTVKTVGYVLGHNSRGVPTSWKIPVSAGGNGIDFLDRQKARIKGTYKYSLFSYDFSLNENDLQGDGDINYKTGPIRTIRDIKYEVNFLGLMTVTVGTFKYQYFPYHMIAFGTNKSLGSDYGIKLIRQSFDLDVDAVGMRFNDPTNININIDGIKENVGKPIYPLPDLNWYMISGTPGTIVMINEFENLTNATASFYYWDKESGGTFDGTSDTGDDKSFGDTGIMFEGRKIQGKFSIPYVTYFLPADQHRDIGEIIVNQYQNLLNSSSTSQDYIPPVEIFVSLPDTTCRQGKTMIIPLRIGDLKEQEISSCQVTIKYDSLILSIDSVSTTNSLVQDWDQPIINLTADSVNIYLQGSFVIPDSGVLLNLIVTAIGIEGQSSSLIFSSAQFNQGDPIAITEDGSCTITAPPEVSITMPDTTMFTNSSILIPVRISDVTNMNVKSCLLEIQYNPLILSASSVSNSGTLSEGWQVNTNYSTGLVTVNLAGNNSLSESGTLINIFFNSLGSSTQTSDLHFQQATFNDGIPILIPQDGQVTVIYISPPEVIVSIPDTTVPSSSMLRIPVNVSSLTGLNVRAYEMNLSFNGNILDFIGADISGSLSAIWNKLVVTDLGNNLRVATFGMSPLQGEGALIFLNFNVPGGSGTNSTIHFENIAFTSSEVLISTYDGIVNIEGAVPVELSSFRATIDKNAVTLFWTTQTETNNYGFFIQRKKDNQLDWETIGSKKGAGTTVIPQSYEYVDFSLEPGKYQYRLNQQDLDGTVNYSHSIIIEILPPTSFSLKQNYPNPFNSLTTISYSIPENGKEVSVQIFNLRGHLIRSLVENKIQNAGDYQIFWNGCDDMGKHVSSGIYYYQLQAGKISISKRMVLIE